MAKKEEWKARSHYERMHNPSIEVVDCVTLPNEVEEYRESISLKDGIKVSKLEKVTSKLSDRNKGLKWTDFSIDSLEVSGAIANLKYSDLEGSKFDMADSIDSIGAGLDVKNEEK